MVSFLFYFFISHHFTDTNSLFCSSGERGCNDKQTTSTGLDTRGGKSLLKLPAKYVATKVSYGAVVATIMFMYYITIGGEDLFM